VPGNGCGEERSGVAIAEPGEQFNGWSALTVAFADGTTREIE
jgi:hypothetical protein